MKYTLILLGAVGLIAFGVTFFKTDTGVSASFAVKPDDLVVHEWGTFTSIAGKDGVAIDWRPLNGPSDLPKFVYSDANPDGYRGTFGPSGKGDMARVRMETPVIYFYTQKAMDVNVSVRFPKGKVTEWYPQASVVNRGFAPAQNANFDMGAKRSGIEWGTVRLLPGEPVDYIRETADSHYYPARETDSVPIQVCNADKSRIEREKFLFYRGIGNFELPLRVRLHGDKLLLGTIEDKFGPKSDPGRNINNAIVFENRGGRIGYTVVPSVSGDTQVARPQLDRTMGDVYTELESILVAQGLYQKEARAMIETWKDSWFEEGVRVFYILPRRTTDEVLPLTVEPRPRETVRVLVGRSEVVTPEMEKAVRGEVDRLRSPSAATRNAAAEALRQHGRFYEPILKSVLARERVPGVRRQIEQLLKAV